MKPAFRDTVEVFTHASLDVLLERRRQVDAKGYSQAADDRYRSGELAGAAAAYAIAAQLGEQVKASHGLVPDERYRTMSPMACWKWPRDAWKPKNPRAYLVRAAALIIAEIERIDRASEREVRP